MENSTKESLKLRRAAEVDFVNEHGDSCLPEVKGHPDQVRAVRGFADQFLMIPDEPLDHRNRRVTLVVLYKSRDSQYDEMAVGDDLRDELGY